MPMHDEPDMDQMGGPSDMDMDNMDAEMASPRDQDGHGQDFQRWQRAVEQDRAQKLKQLKSSQGAYDQWDMEWRKRAKQSGLDEQEVDAFMDSLWEQDDGPEYDQDEPDRYKGYSTGGRF